MSETSAAKGMNYSIGHPEPMEIILKHWPQFIPIAAAVLLGWSLSTSVAGGMVWLAFAFMMLAVIASVHHAELIAHRIGEPFGTLVLALAVTVIETALILSVMMTDGAKSAALPRDRSEEHTSELQSP